MGPIVQTILTLPSDLYIRTLKLAAEPGCRVEDGGVKIRTVNGYETWGPEQKK